MDYIEISNIIFQTRRKSAGRVCFRIKAFLVTNSHTYSLLFFFIPLLFFSLLCSLLVSDFGLCIFLWNLLFWSNCLGFVLPAILDLFGKTSRFLDLHRSNLKPKRCIVIIKRYLYFRSCFFHYSFNRCLHFQEFFRELVRASICD